MLINTPEITVIDRPRYRLLDAIAGRRAYINTSDEVVILFEVIGILLYRFLRVESLENNNASPVLIQC